MRRNCRLKKHSQPMHETGCSGLVHWDDTHTHARARTLRRALLVSAQLCTHTHTHAHAHTLRRAPLVSAQLQPHTAPLNAPLNTLGALSPAPGAGKRHCHFLLFSPTGPGSLASILGKQEAGGQQRCSQVEQETARLATQTLVLRAEVSSSGRGRAARRSGGLLATESEPDPGVTQDSSDPRLHGLSPPWEGQHTLPKHCEPEYFNTCQKNRQRALK